MLFEVEYDSVEDKETFKKLTALVTELSMVGASSKEWRAYETLTVYLDEELPAWFLRWHVENDHVLNLFGEEVKPSQNMELFTKNVDNVEDLSCVTCGLVPRFWALQRSGNRPFHLNLWGTDSDGKLRLFTKDHVLPKAKGGLDEMDNYQPMCMRCNQKKGDRYEV